MASECDIQALFGFYVLSDVGISVGVSQDRHVSHAHHVMYG